MENRKTQTIEDIRCEWTNCLFLQLLTKCGFILHKYKKMCKQWATSKMSSQQIVFGSRSQERPWGMLCLHCANVFCKKIPTTSRKLMFFFRNKMAADCLQRDSGTQKVTFFVDMPVLLLSVSRQMYSYWTAVLLLPWPDQWNPIFSLFANNGKLPLLFFIYNSWFKGGLCRGFFWRISN